MKVVCIKDNWEAAEVKEIKESYFWGFYKTTRHEKVPRRVANAPKKGEVLEVVNTKHDVENFTNKVSLFYWFNEYEWWCNSSGFRPVDESEENEADKKIEELLQTN